MMKIDILASGSKGNCYKVTSGESVLLIECGLPVQQLKKALNYQLSEIDACLVSHEHMDHAAGVKGLLESGVDVHMSLGTMQALDIKHHRMHRLAPKNKYRIGDFQIVPFDVRHDAAEPLGFQVSSGNKKLVFITDTFYVKYKFSDMTHLMIECNYDLDVLDAKVNSGEIDSYLRNRIRKSHMGLHQVKEMLKANDLSRLQEVYLLHLSDGNSDEEKMKREVQEIVGVPVYIAGEN